MVALMTPRTNARGPADDDEARWQAVLAADRALDGAFVTAVRTTRIYCRPSCPARKPKRENVEFLATPDAAERAGYRACKRCHPREAAAIRSAALIQRICERHRDGDGAAPTLARTRRGVRPQPVSPPAHIQAHHRRDAAPVRGRASRRAAEGGAARSRRRDGGGVSRRLWLQQPRLREDRARAGHDAGGVRARRARHAYPLHDRGLRAGPRARRGDGPRHRLRLHGRRRAAAGGGAAERVSRGGDRARRAARRGDTPTRSCDAISEGHADHALPVDVLATAFQARVWQALREIPRGETRSYVEVARAIGQPKAARAVARGLRRQPDADHRAVPPRRSTPTARSPASAGASARKQKLLEQERAVNSARDAARGLRRIGACTLGACADTSPSPASSSRATARCCTGTRSCRSGCRRAGTSIRTRIRCRRSCGRCWRRRASRRRSCRTWPTHDVQQPAATAVAAVDHRRRLSAHRRTKPAHQHIDMCYALRPLAGRGAHRAGGRPRLRPASRRSSSGATSRCPWRRAGSTCRWRRTCACWGCGRSNWSRERCRVHVRAARPAF